MDSVTNKTRLAEKQKTKLQKKYELNKRRNLIRIQNERRQKKYSRRYRFR